MKGNEILAMVARDNQLLERFTRYAAVDTRSDPQSATCPSTPKQLELAAAIVEDLKALGLHDAMVDAHGYVYASLASNCQNALKVALLAHIDVSFDCASAHIQPMVHRQYKGGPLTLKLGEVIDPKDNPRLLDCLGDTIITSDGTTLLGADDKAGVVEIIEMLAFFIAHPEVKHPGISICFTPDEEKGTGIDKIDLDKIGAKVGFTVDGGFCGEVNLENFDAYSCKVTFKGINYHPGQAWGKMVNAVRYAAMFVDLLPKEDAPEHTKGRQGFIHPTSVTGEAGEAVVNMLLRAFSLDDIERLKGIVTQAAAKVRASEPRLQLDAAFQESYRNMAEVMRRHEEIRLYLERAAAQMEIILEYVPIRGGTDGCRLSFMGLPCPNIFTGGLNFHSTKEWISLDKMVFTSAFLVCLMTGMTP